MRSTAGWVLFTAGLAGLGWVRSRTPSSSLGWSHWNRRQRVTGLVCLAVLLAGMIVIG
ncbi:hypothetical protein [Streptomyces sp. NRRL B-24484]|uniref:hypothetical protein n=1 Tax=Streptomyces sp. NRRL B-24484 TaxID=1463833 RepID=UPI000ADF2BEF|nr:hypothetical protein [Streptomyces sp. NRRL B-24484]